MTLTEIEKKLLMLAMDRSATNDEVAAAAKKFIESLRKRFPSGPELIAALESGVGDAQPGDIVFPTQAAAQRAANAMNHGFGGFDWGDIMRDAQRMGQQRAAAAAQQRQQTWEEYCRTHNIRRET